LISNSARNRRQLHDVVERYLSEQYGFDRYQSINRSAAGWDPLVWRGLAELGVLGMTVPVAQGGLGFGPLETLAMMGDCGRSLLLEPVLSSAVIAYGRIVCLRRRDAGRRVAGRHGYGREDRGTRAFRERRALR